MMTIKMFLEEQQHIPWPALEYVIGQINYGGRVTDDLDRRCIMSILRKYVTPHLLIDGYKFSPSGTYYAPQEGDLDSYRDYLHGLPSAEAPEVFGMHANADISFQLQETRKLIEAVTVIQPRVSGTGGGKSLDDVVSDLIKEISDKLEAPLSKDDCKEGLFDRTESGQLNSLSVVLEQEMDRFNRYREVSNTFE